MPPDAAASAAQPLTALAVNIGAFVEAALTTPWVVFIVAPLLVAVGSVFLKAFARETYVIKQEDKVVGFDLGATACITLLASGVAIASDASAVVGDANEVRQYLIGIFITLIGIIAVLIAAATFFRKKGWDSANPNAPVRKWWLFGINALGVFLLITAFSISGGGLK